MQINLSKTFKSSEIEQLIYDFYEEEKDGLLKDYTIDKVQKNHYKYDLDISNGKSNSFYISYEKLYKILNCVPHYLSNKTFFDLISTMENKSNKMSLVNMLVKYGFKYYTFNKTNINFQKIYKEDTIINVSICSENDKIYCVSFNDVEHPYHYETNIYAFSSKQKLYRLLQSFR